MGHKVAADKPAWRPARLLLLSMLGTIAFLLLPIAVPALLPTASAHDTLASSSPADGDSVEQAPTTLDLTYSDDVLNLSPVVRLNDSAGNEIFAETPTVTDNTASIDLPPLPADDYEIQWRVVSSDGHPIEGTVRFTVTVGAEESGADASTVEEDPSTASVEPNTSPTASDQAASQRPEEDRNSPPLSVILGGVGLLLALGLVVAITLRVRGRASADD